MTAPPQSAPITLPTLHAAGDWRPHVIGLDLSLTSTGIAGTDWARACRPGRRRSHERLDWLSAHIADAVQDADLVVVEGAAYAQGAQAGHHELAGLWWVITQYLWCRRIPYAVANPHHRTIYATGRANPAQQHPRTVRAKIAKGMVRSAVAERYSIPCEGPGRYDQADAVILAAMGLDWLGYPTAPVPDTHRRALEAVAWPERPPAAAK
ncbi:hypothetical protein [Streptomyces fractus]|uniref:hypothetical protein n=1 Tax=Streptomyces fractus TaxID=641806 RepID=UPI003CF6412A